MELRLLEFFLTVAREESINRAAEVIHISQPTLSRQLALLEEELGVKLFIRGNKGVKLTDEGILLQRRAQEILDLVGKTEDELQAQDAEVEGIITIGAGELASFAYLGSLMKSFRAAHPRVRYDVISGAADEITEGMDRGLIDISLLLEPVNISKYEFIRLPGTEHWACAMRPDDALAQKDLVTPADLAGRQLLLPRRMSVQRELAHWFGKRWAKLNVFCTQSLTTNCSMIVAQGPEISLIIEGSLPDRDRSRIITRRLQPDLQASSVVCWKRDVPAPAAVTAFIDFLGSQSES